MSAKWSFGSVGIFVEEKDESYEVKKAELIVLDATSSTLHHFGGGSNHYVLNGLVIGDTDKNQLGTWAKAGTAQTLTTPFGSLGSCVIFGEPKFTNVKFTGATIDGTDYTASDPIYRCEIELVSTS